MISETRGKDKGAELFYYRANGRNFQTIFTVMSISNLSHYVVSILYIHLFAILRLKLFFEKNHEIYISVSLKLGRTLNNFCTKSFVNFLFELNEELIN